MKASERTIERLEENRTFPDAQSCYLPEVAELSNSLFSAAD